MERRHVLERLVQGKAARAAARPGADEAAIDAPCARVQEYQLCHLPEAALVQTRQVRILLGAARVAARQHGLHASPPAKPS